MTGNWMERVRALGPLAMAVAEARRCHQGRISSIIGGHGTDHRYAESPAPLAAQSATHVVAKS